MLAFQLETKSKRYTALSTDVKTVVGIEAGSICKEVDTGEEWEFSGTAWVQTVTAVSIVGSLTNLQGIVNVTTAGTRVQLSADQACREVTIIAKRLNVGYIYVGTVAVSASAYGVELAAKESITIPVANLNQIYIDSSVNGEGISYVAV